TQFQTNNHPSMRVFLLSLLMVLGSVQIAAAQPSSIDLRALDNLFTEQATVEVNLRGALLNLVAEASRNDEPEFASIVDDLRGIFVRQYALSSAQSGMRNRVDSMARTLETNGWETLVRVREDDEQTFVYLLSEGNVINGMVVMSLDEGDDEATFVSIDGRIDPAHIGRLGGHFGVPEID
ncbi:MAG: DUF4252 domain-containing protein, partial [Rubricoccaceae bacterium]|nr:DUF4252 domain-containing protein [Rubricoccaceae bacterium]